MDIDRNSIDILAHLLTQTLDIIESCRVFLSRDDTTGLGKLLKGLIDELDVLRLETMMVGKRQWRNILD